MSTPFAHLHPAVREMLALGDNKRIQALQRDRWIDGFDPLRGVEQRPVISMQMPLTPDQRRFYRALLSVIGAPQGPSSTRSPETSCCGCRHAC